MMTEEMFTVGARVLVTEGRFVNEPGEITAISTDCIEVRFDRYSDGSSYFTFWPTSIVLVDTLF